MEVALKAPWLIYLTIQSVFILNFKLYYAFKKKHLCKLRKECQSCSLRFTERKTYTKRTVLSCVVVFQSIFKKKKKGIRGSFLYSSHCYRKSHTVPSASAFVPSCILLSICVVQKLRPPAPTLFCFHNIKGAEFSLPWLGSDCGRSWKVKPWVRNSLGQRSLFSCVCIVH